MTAKHSDTLIIGAATGYTEQQVAPFLASLRKAGYRGDLALIVDPKLARQARTSPLFKDIILLTTPQWAPVRYWMLKNRPRLALAIWRLPQAVGWCLLRVLWRSSFSTLRNAALHLAKSLFPPTESRYLHYLQFLQHQPYSRVLLTDVRDVVFQSNPFETLPEQGLAVSLESRKYAVATQPHNARWVAVAYGSAMLQEIGGRPISCSGVTYGDRPSIEHYLRAMSTEILRLNLRAAGTSGVDQGIHNVLLWTGRLGTPVLLETLRSPVATIGGIEDSQFPINARGQLLNQDGTVASIVHQYDRSPLLRSTLSAALQPYLAT